MTFHSGTGSLKMNVSEQDRIFDPHEQDIMNEPQCINEFRDRIIVQTAMLLTVTIHYFLR